MATGTVKWFSSEKGYGFIESGDGSADVFAQIDPVARRPAGTADPSPLRAQKGI